VHPNGLVSVSSQSCPGKHYRVCKVCQCPDASRAPQGHCKHLLAVMLQRRATTVAAQRLANGGPIVPEAPLTPAAVDAIAPAQPVTPTAPLPEAPISITLKAKLHGQDIMVTLRGTDFASVRAQVEQASAWLQAQA
jgi:hypothetical protein